uniref:General transcription and DNA repair factor IIH helicase subunit XPD n=1 Tax=Dermatophagoides pteronyssinus TaxID=6956 RepID=A0A6P6YBP7_DERPT|nr:general transcription and DNA repair factor IIH helicase subunit XPD-like [Dermatophagoides pteronyssinus]
MVVFNIEELKIFFPYDYIYPEQYVYMRHLKTTLDTKGHGVLEMPTGTGKTVCIMSLYSSYQLEYPEKLEKFYFCTRTIGEMNKALFELRCVLKYRLKILVTEFLEIDKIDEKCRSLTVPWVRERFYDKKIPNVRKAYDYPGSNMKLKKSFDADESEKSLEANNYVHDIEDLYNKIYSKTECSLCPWYESFKLFWIPENLPNDVYTIDDMKIISPDPLRSRFCPYYATRELNNIAQIVVLNYQYVLDPKVSRVAMGYEYSTMNPLALNKVNGQLSDQVCAIKKPHAIVFDEAHNIDNVCIEALTIKISSVDIEQAKISIKKLQKLIEENELQETNKLTEQLIKSVTAEQEEQYAKMVNEFLNSPLLPEEQSKLSKTIPGTIRKNRLFLNNLLMMIVYLDSYVKVVTVNIEGPLMFLKKVEDTLSIEASTLSLYSERLKNLLSYLKITNFNEYSSLTKITDYCTLVSTYYKGFILITDPYPEAPGIYDPISQLACIDSSLSMKPVLDRFQSVMLTSGTISPLNLYPKILKFVPTILQSLNMSLERECICPIIVSKGSDNIPLSSVFELRDDVSVIQQYGRLITDLCEIIPDGIVLFFTSYAYMENVLSHWNSDGVIDKILANKLIFMETKDSLTTSLTLDSYKKACDIGRGAIFMSIARGKVAEGIDFDRHYGRAVILIGVPYQYTLSHVLKSRLLFLKVQYQIDEGEFLAFDAMRQASQCLGRVIRNKLDYGLMILADYRYAKNDKLTKLPEWVKANLTSDRVNIIADHAISLSNNFLLEMSQPHVQSLKTRLNQAALTKLSLLGNKATNK